MSKKNGSRRRFTTEQKATILRRHMADKVTVTDLCEAPGVTLRGAG